MQDDKDRLLELAERLADYNPCMDAGYAICDRRTVDEAVQTLRALAQELRS